MRAPPSLDSLPSGAMTEKSHGSPPGPTNNDVIDPYSEDRRLAMHQLSPRTRPAVPREPREPIVIAQYAQRYPQPPGITGIPTLPSERQQSTYASRERAATVTSSPTTKHNVTLAAASTAETPSAVSKSSPATIAATETTLTTTTTITTTFVENIIGNKSNTTEPKLADAKVFNDITHERVIKSEETSPKGVQKVEKPVLNNAVDEKSQTDIQKHANGNDEKPLLSMPAIDSTTYLNISTTVPSTTPAIPHLRTTLTENKKSHHIHAVANMVPTSFVFTAPDFAQRDATRPLHSSKTLLNNVVRSKSPQSSYEKVSIRGRESRLHRLKMLNQRARIRPLAVMAVGGEHYGQKNHPKHLENEIDQLQKRIYLAKNKLAIVLKTTSPAPDKRVEDDTALALSWMFANMAKMMKEKSSGTVPGGPRQIRHVTDKAHCIPIF
uniref:BHLH domain-containing protein n=1 Tax=Angiostrongylus cantonensis TaxID=6313 RepID=A0A0K0D9S7_ANGCA